MPRSKYSTGLEGARFNRLTVVEFAYSRPEGGKSNAYYWKCDCDCGNQIVTNARLLFRGKSGSCGCLKVDLHSTHFLKHGHGRNKTRTREYGSWLHLIQRCDNPKHNKSWHRYGGRGIKACKGIRNFTVFFSMVGLKPTVKHSIDRVNNDGHYSCGECCECLKNKWPFNLRWATSKEQAANTCRSLKYAAG